MKKKLLLLCGLMTIVLVVAMAFTYISDTKREEKQGLTIVTSFYPMYVVAENIIGQIEDIELVNLTNYTSGCLHDYQLSTSDMKRLEEADILIINGGGMESFMEDVFSSYPELPIITASEGISFLLSEEHDHSEEEDSEHEHSEEEYNAHVWMNMEYYLVQIKNIVERLSELDPDHAKIYEENGLNYSKKVEALKQEFEETLNLNDNKKIVIFHDAFAYLAQEFELNIVHTVNMDSETALSAGEIAEVVDEVREEDVRVLFTEEQYKASIASNIAVETGAKVYVIDSGVTGDMDKDAYLNSMKTNLQILKEAFGE
jgi:zinc transport system substrate-binding protein